jgi:RNA polymerase sigma-70 factor (sigma-E family)
MADLTGGAVRAGDESEYVAYLTARLPSLRRMAAQLVGDAHRGDDLVQQAITKLYTHWRRATQASNLDSYVYRILVRAFLDEKRLRWAAVRLGIEPVDRPDPPTVDVEGRMLLREALAVLPPRQRAAVALRYLADLSVDEVAEILGVSPGTVKSQTHDGLAALRRQLTVDPDRPATRRGVTS